MTTSEPTKSITKAKPKPQNHPRQKQSLIKNQITRSKQTDTQTTNTCNKSRHSDLNLNKPNQQTPKQPELINKNRPNKINIFTHPIQKISRETQT
jgi:hypothetical protein